MLRLIVLFTIVAAPSAALAKDYYFDPSGGDDNDPCTSSKPCKSENRMNGLLQSANPGDQFLWKRGKTRTVSRPIRFESGRNGSSSKPIVIGAYGSGAQPVLDGSGLSGGVPILQCKVTSDYEIRDLRFVNGKGALLMRGCSNITFESNTISACDAECLHAKYSGATPSSHITIRDNVFNTSRASERIYIGTDPGQSNGQVDTTHDVLIENNEFTGNAANEVIEMKCGSHDVTIRGNYIHDTSVGNQNGIIFSARISPCQAGNHVIERNFISNVSGSQAHAIRMRNDATVRYNVIVGVAQRGIAFESGAYEFQRLAEFNTVYDNDSRCIDATGSNTTVRNNICWRNGSGNDGSDPRFVNAGADDFNLEAGSPAIGQAAGVAHSGALQTFDTAVAELTSDGSSLVLTHDVFGAYRPLRGCDADDSALQLSCSSSGQHTAASCSVTGDDTTTYVLSSPVAANESCTVSFSAGGVSDGASIGGRLRSTSFARSDLAVGRGAGGPPCTPAMAVAAVSASSHDANANAVPANAIDGDPSTRWSAYPVGEHITFDLGQNSAIGSLRIAWHKGDSRRASFRIQVSNDGTAFAELFSGTSSGASLDFEAYDIPDTSARYLRIVGDGNVSNNGTTTSGWNSITEVEIYDPDGATSCPALFSSAFSDAGGCTVAGSGPSTPNIAWLALIGLALAFASRRRRRRDVAAR